MKIDSNKLDSNIVWVCFSCGNKADKRKLKPKSTGVTCHTTTCDVCGEYVGVCNVRNFGYPVFDVRAFNKPTKKDC